jgi:hypothetical protein
LDPVKLVREAECILHVQACFATIYNRSLISSNFVQKTSLQQKNIYLMTAFDQPQ